MRAQAASVAKQCLEGLRGDVFNRLCFHDVFTDPIPNEIESIFYPMLQEKMKRESERLTLAQEVTQVAVQAAKDQGDLVHRAVIARDHIKTGWANRDFLTFNQGFKELNALHLDDEVAAARKQFGELHKAYTEAKYKEDLAASQAAVKKYYGRAEKDGAKLTGSAIQKLEKLLGEAELLGEIKHVWDTRSRIQAIRIRSDAAILEQFLAKTDADEQKFKSAVEAKAPWEDDTTLLGDPAGWTRPVLADGGSAVLARRVEIASDEPEEAAAEEEEPEAVEGEDQPAEEGAEEEEATPPPVYPMIFNPDDVTCPQNARFALAVKVSECVDELKS